MEKFSTGATPPTENVKAAVEAVYSYGPYD